MPSFSKLTDVAASYNPKPGLHYVLSCYVCGRACIKPSPFDGWVTFERIFQQRPDKCRFAIARQLELTQPTAGNGGLVYERSTVWVCWDLLDDSLIDRASRAVLLLHPPEPKWTSPVEEALVMRAMALYDHP